MKNTIKWKTVLHTARIIVMVAIIGFAMLGCASGVMVFVISAGEYIGYISSLLAGG